MIDSSVRPIGIKSDFIPPQPESLFSSNSLIFILLNALTVGIYGSFEILSKQHKITALSFNQNVLQQKAYELSQSWEELENNLRDVSILVNDRLATQSTEFQDIQTTLNGVERRNVHYRMPLNNLSEKLESSVTSVALDCIAFFSQLFINVVTLGVYGIYQNSALRNQIRLIKEENDYITREINKIKGTKSDAIAAQIVGLRNIVSNYCDLEEVRHINLEETRALIIRLNEQIEELQLETRELSNQVTAAKTADVQLRKAVQDLGVTLNVHTRDLKNLADEHDRLMRSGATQGTEARNLQSKILSYQRDIELAKAAASRVALMQKDVSQRKFIQSQWGEIQRSQKDLGFIPPMYKKRDEDGEIQGAYGIVLGEDDDDQMSDYAKRYNDKKTAAELVQAGFDFAFDDLLAKAQEPNAYIVFNESSKIYQNAKYAAHKNAIFCRIIWDFIENAGLQQLDCHGYGLNLNNNGISMRASNPVRVQTYRDVGETRELEQRVLLTQVDEFSPQMEDRDLRFGIDPPSAKWIFEQLSPEGKKHLFNLLMEPFIANDAQQLVDLEQFLAQADDKHELVRIAYGLICDMAKVLMKNFDDKGLLTELWLKKANAEDLLPLEKEPFAGTEQLTLVNDLREPVCVPWTPNMDALFGNGTDAHRGNFIQHFFEAQLEYQNAFQAITTDQLQNPFIIRDQQFWNNPVRWTNRLVNRHWDSPVSQYGISYQYHGSCETLGATQKGCLFSSLLTVLMGHRESITEQNAIQLRKIVADSLDNPKIAQKFADRISQTHKKRNLNGVAREGMSVAEYQQALRDNRLDSANYGEIEIELVALAFGVRIGVLVAGEQTKLDENGLMIPANQRRYFGPLTREVLMLYNKSGSTYYGLFPKLKVLDVGDNASESIRGLRQYWLSRDKIEDID